MIEPSRKFRKSIPLTGPVCALAFSRDGRYLASAAVADHQEGTFIRVWDMLDNQEVTNIFVEDHTIWNLTFDQGRLVYDQDKLSSRFALSVLFRAHSFERKVYEIPTGQEVSCNLNLAGAFAFSIDGRFVARNVREYIPNLKLDYYDPSKVDLVEVLVPEDNLSAFMDEHKAEANHIGEFSSDGHYLCLDTSEGVYVWETLSGRIISKLKPKGVVRCVAFSPDELYLYVGTRYRVGSGWDAEPEGEDGLEIWRVSDGELIEEFGGYADTIRFSPDGRFFVKTEDDEVELRETVKFNKIASYTSENNRFRLAFSSDSKYLAIASSLDNVARIVETENGREVAQLYQQGGVHSIIFSPDGHYLVTGGRNLLLIW